MKQCIGSDYKIINSRLVESRCTHKALKGGEYCYTCSPKGISRLTHNNRYVTNTFWKYQSFDIFRGHYPA